MPLFPNGILAVTDSVNDSSIKAINILQQAKSLLQCAPIIKTVSGSCQGSYATNRI